MPKGQLLFSAVFGFRNPRKEIFSESDEIKTQHPIFDGRFQSTEEGPEGSQEGPTPQGGAAKGVGAPPYGVGTPWPLRLRLFAYLKPPDLKHRHQLTKPEKTF